jgi:polyhydroxyalkanoate synthesis regulator protein
MGPDTLAKMAETNMAMFKAATSAFMPGHKPAEPAAPKPAASSDDLDALREQMAEMQRKLDELRK